MSSFWPEGVELSDTQSPKDILKTAQEEWQTASDGILDLILQDAESKSGNSMIIVHAKNVATNRTATLFSIVHEPKKPYPLTIQLEKENLPTFLKKSYYTKDSQFPVGLQAILDYDPIQQFNARPNPFANRTSRLDVKPVVNKWVSDTPSEFREKLSEAFNLGIVKRVILNLAAANSITAKNNNGDLIDHQDPN
jgi:hypothetical protein